MFLYRLLFKKSTIDTHIQKQKESKHNTKFSHQITREEGEMKDVQKQIQSNWQNENKIYILNLLSVKETQIWFLGWKDPLETGMATCSSIHAWRIPWTEEQRKQQSMGLQRVWQHWATITHTHNDNYLKWKWF